MNSRHYPHTRAHAEILQNRFGLRVAARLSAGSAELPHDISERLRATREQAVARRKQAVAVTRLRTAPAVVRYGNTVALGGFGDDVLGLWGRLTSAVLVIAMAVALITINIVQEDDRVSEVAEVDAALLTDDLPPAAYSDPGFLQFLKTDSAARTSSQ
ncbi:DUF3619 family protein [Ottowia thiooxydans]|uniref:DUF3619 family protein n=1 Tax=Ottowia thiooxydans TaxID=219182 RepID=UPI00041A5855|nr:DUF3619 family protein [Ottowia thiooxydans]